MGSIKKSVLLFLVLLFAVFTGCSNTETKHEDAIRHIKAIKTYYCKADISVINDKQKLEYKCRIYHDSKRGSAIDINDKRKLIFKDNCIYVTDKASGKKYIQNRNFDEVYHLAFIDDYINLMYKNQKAECNRKEINGTQYELISFDINGNNRNISKGTLYLSEKGFMPKKLIIYDNTGTEKIVITYSGYVANKKISSKLFKFNI
ncbi:germination lipoprotein GerS-related protein [Clostridium oryzae]|uniref:Uncharacterized protein n=1 Tax=Clostridium oryzae TaxID=1450648 RepID=A0A1V4IZ48_9CLOT|nr:germination lipoprotein GerS-related protein [Clostridium oryzae]OPJ65100.1 hypothetical protein CLORY_01000 [Clostridium oryzae]